MKFELTEYHKNVSDEEFIEDVRKIAEKLNKRTLTGAEYSKHGTYHSSTLTKRFGSWKLILEKSGLETKGHNFKYAFTDDDVILDLKRVANTYQSNGVTVKEYDKYGTYSSSTLIKRYGTWNRVLKLAGMRLNINRNFTNEEMLEEIERVWIVLGHQPTTIDIKNGVSKFSLQSYARRFGGWRGALQAFINYINTEAKSPLSELQVQEYARKETPMIKENDLSHKTSRDINLRLRFKVMQRDNFMCCACGASPAKDPSVVLHIDHIIPWSKGGETVDENLQTLCSKCNLGKSDLL